MPGFPYLGGELLHAAVAGGARIAAVSLYLDSILEFAGHGDERLAGLRRHRRSTGGYPTTEAGLLAGRASGNGHISEDEGLLLVREACDELEAQVFRPGLREGETSDTL